ncbi:MAG: hypothetical protein ACFCD0_10005 [Gemmataceae bacterium]
MALSLFVVCECSDRLGRFRGRSTIFNPFVRDATDEGASIELSFLQLVASGHQQKDSLDDLAY